MSVPYPFPRHEKSERCRRSLADGAAVSRVLIAVADRCGVVRGVDGYGSVTCDVTGYSLVGPASGERTLLFAKVAMGRADG